jgi:hypothetical protein
LKKNSSLSYKKYLFFSVKTTQIEGVEEPVGGSAIFAEEKIIIIRAGAGAGIVGIGLYGDSLG